jgi:hypothetical protein
MPNWCYNSLSIEGSAEDISAIKSQLNKPFARMHDQFNMKTKQMELTETTYSNPVFAFHNVYNHIQAGISDEDYMKQPDHTLPLSEALTFKGNHWYDFNVREWGTKWDVAIRDGEEYPETELVEEDDSSLAYRFNTAWSPPIPAIANLSQQYPDLEFTLSYEEETGWGGEILFVSGEQSDLEIYDNKCRDCDSLNTMDYCENECGEICSSCNYMAEADLEAVAECQTHKVFLDEEHVPEYRKDQVNV